MATPSASASASSCFYVKAPNGRDQLVCVEKRKHGYSGWLYSRGVVAKRLPVSTGKAKSMSEAIRNAKKFLRDVGRKSRR